MGWREVMFKYMYSAHRDGRGEGSAGTFYYNALLLHTLYILPSYRYVCVPLTELGQASSNVKGGVYVTVCVCPVISERRPLFSKHFSISRADRIHRERRRTQSTVKSVHLGLYSSAVYNLNAFKSNYYLAVVQSCISLSGFKRVFRKNGIVKLRRYTSSRFKPNTGQFVLGHHSQGFPGYFYNNGKHFFLPSLYAGYDPPTACRIFIA